MRAPACHTTILALLAGATASCGPGASSSVEEVYTPLQVRDAAGASLGSVAFPVACGTDAGQHVRRGVALLHHMTYVEAANAFRTATATDPGCAIGYWGEAMSFLHPLWPDVPPPEALERGWELLQEARATASLTAREEAYVEALEAYYEGAGERSEPERLERYAAAWKTVAAAYPDDPEAELFHALSLIALAPAAEDGHAIRVEAGAMAESALARIPDHPGAHHYVIHAFDVPALAERAIPVARTYGEVAPDNAHALHMTSHIFTRVGAWEESIDYNTRSADAGLRNPIDGATSHHHLHAVDYLAYAYLQRADDERAQAVLEGLAALDGPVVDHAASAYAFAAVPARLALERQAWDDAARITPRWPSTIAWDRYPHLEAIPHFARALGAARTGNLVQARAAVRRLGELAEAAASLPGAYDWGTQVEIQALGARAWIAFQEGRTDDALDLMTRAADLESSTEKNPVTPGEALPARELLGDLLLEVGRFDEAGAAYTQALRRSPNRFNSLFGAGRAAELAGDRQAAISYYRQLVELTEGGGRNRPALDHARAFVSG